MAQSVCPHCGHPTGDSGDAALLQVSPGTPDQGQSVRQAQLMEYARDLARVYAIEKRMAQYLPSGVRERIRQDSQPVIAERRQVTVLCADLANFTQLTAHLQPEDVFDLINACFRQLVSHIFKYGGMVDKFLGDGIMAVFGAPVAHEDDPIRAVQAALDMDAEMRVFSRKVHMQLGAPLQLHIGINCGEAIAGSVGVDEQLSYTVVGQTVSLAFRLQEVAESGDILVSQAVQQATQHLFKYCYRDAVEVKGFVNPVPVFSVENRQESHIVVQSTTDIQLPWTGRTHELDELRPLLERLAKGEGGVVLISGDAGVGKTRLARQWLSLCTTTNVAVWTGAAQMTQSRIGYSLWRNMTQLASSTPGPDAKVTDTGDVISLSGRVIPLSPAMLALVYGQPALTPAPQEAEDARDQIFQAVRNLLVTQSQMTPLALAVDNWQWTDEISRQLLLSLLPLADEHPILFCILSRPTPGHLEDTTRVKDVTRTVEFQAIRNYHRIDLDPLTAEDIQYLLSSLFSPSSLSRDAQAVMQSWTQGNPFFLKELMLFLDAQGFIEQKGKRWHLAQPYPLSSLRFPPTLRGLTMANLDRLPEDLQEVLQCAAVIGTTFSFRLLQAVMAREQHANELAGRLQELIRRRLVEPSAMDADAFSFHHTIVQESIIERLLAQRLQTLHRYVAEEMERLAETDLSISVELMAYHFIQAHVPARAVRYLIQSGQRARGYAASQLAIDHYMAALVALEYAPRHQSERLDVEIGLADAYLQSHQYDEAINHYQVALDLCEDIERRIGLRQTLSHTYAAQGNLEKAWEHLEAALEMLSEGNIAGNSVVRGRVFSDCAQVEWRMGNKRRAELWAREAMAILEGSSEHSSLAASYQTLGQVYALLGQHSLANSYTARATAHLQATNRFRVPQPASTSLAVGA